MVTSLVIAPVDVPESRRHKKRIGGITIPTWIGVGLLALCALLGLVVLLAPPFRNLWTAQDLRATFLPPLSSGHPFGTDNLGRDLMWRTLAGLGVSVAVGLGVAFLAVTLGLMVGIVGGYFGRAADVTSNIVIDVTWAFPAILLAVVFAGWLGPGLLTVVLALALTEWAGFSRIIRGEVLSLRERDYVSAARVLGRNKVAISLRHFVPNLLPVTLVLAVYFVAGAIVAEAGLSFLGIGAQPPTPSLGSTLAQGRDYLTRTWWPVILAGGVLTLTVLLLNSVSDQLREHFDPRIGRRR
ncbi:MAG: ABC transporter permease [Actinomycetes bacterium]